MMEVFTNGIKIVLPGGKIIEEFMGVKRGEERFSVAHMVMPPGWSEVPHETEYDEIVIVIKGNLTVTDTGHKFKVLFGQVGWIKPSKSVAFSNEDKEICEYWAVCIPAYHPSRVHYLKGEQHGEHG